MHTDRSSVDSPVARPRIHLLNFATFSGPIASPSRLNLVLCIAVWGIRGSVFERDTRLRAGLGGSDFSTRLGEDGDLSCPFMLGVLPGPMGAFPPEIAASVRMRGRAVGECGGSDRSVSPMSASSSSSIVARRVIRIQMEAGDDAEDK